MIKRSILHRQSAPYFESVFDIFKFQFMFLWYRFDIESKYKIKKYKKCNILLRQIVSIVEVKMMDFSLYADEETKVDEICEKYGLAKLHGQTIVEDYTV